MPKDTLHEIYRAAYVGNIARVRTLVEQDSTMVNRVCGQSGATVRPDGMLEALSSDLPRAVAMVAAGYLTIQYASLLNGVMQARSALTLTAASLVVGSQELKFVESSSLFQLLEHLRHSHLSPDNQFSRLLVDKKWTPLHFAALGNSTAVAKFLISTGADIAAIDSCRRTFQMLPVSSSFLNGCKDAIIERLDQENIRLKSDLTNERVARAEEQASTEAALKELEDRIEGLPAFAAGSAGHFAPPNVGAAGAGAAPRPHPG